jgi:hypothetical protein
MTDSDDDQTPAANPAAERRWDPVEIMRARAAATREQRDRSIAELRQHLSDVEILEGFGLNLDELDEPDE